MKKTIVIALMALISFNTFATDLSTYSVSDLRVMQDHNLRVLSALERDHPLFEEIVLEAKEIIIEINGRVPLDEEDSRKQEEILKSLI